jgi:hypothetical protein
MNLTCQQNGKTSSELMSLLWKMNKCINPFSLGLSYCGQSLEILIATFYPTC